MRKSVILKTQTSIRIAQEKDAHQIAEVHVLSWQKIYRGIIPDEVLDSLSVEKRTEKWHELIQRGIKILLIEKGNKLLGFASIGPARDNDKNPKSCGEITAIYLHPDYWHQGLGKKLCNEVFLTLKEMRFTEVILWVLKQNNQARQFYEGLDFKETGDAKIEVYDSTIDLQEIRYQKQLSESPNKYETVIETERMYLRKLTMDDVNNLQKIFSDPITMQYYPKTYSIEETKAWIEKVLNNYKIYGAGMWACHLKSTNEFVGQCGLHFQKDIDGKDEVEIGYLFVRNFWHQGLATEAAKASLNFAREELKQKRLISLIRPENLPSRRVAERNGLIPEKEIWFKGYKHIVYVSE